MLDPNIKDKEGLPLTCRAVFIVGPDKKLKLSLNYPASVGRNMDEIVRVVDALQLSAKYSVVRTACSITTSSRTSRCFCFLGSGPVITSPSPSLYDMPTHCRGHGKHI
jgi:hypothetical protein